MHVVVTRKKDDLNLVIAAPKVRARPPRGGGPHRDRRRQPRATQRVRLRRELVS